jgi:hypothetical protein
MFHLVEELLFHHRSAALEPYSEVQKAQKS